jgi:MinD-like ATPase involved in chromosome partitioning or flagellar assembly
MSVVAIGSLHGSPGATTLAIALAGHAATSGSSALVVEADPDGGTMAARLDLRLQPSFTDLAGAARSGIEPEHIWRFAQSLGGGLGAIIAHPSPDQMVAALRASGGHVGSSLPALEATVTVDLGRLRPSSPSLALAAGASRTVIVVRPELAEIMAVLHRVDALRSTGPLGLVLVGETPYGRRQVAEVTGLEVLGVVPDDAKAVRADPYAVGRARRATWPAAIAELCETLELGGAAPAQPPAVAVEPATTEDHGAARIEVEAI